MCAVIADILPFSLLAQGAPHLCEGLELQHLLSAQHGEDGVVQQQPIKPVRILQSFGLEPKDVLQVLPVEHQDLFSSVSGETPLYGGGTNASIRCLTVKPASSIIFLWPLWLKLAGVMTKAPPHCPCGMSTYPHNVKAKNPLTATIRDNAAYCTAGIRGRSSQWWTAPSGPNPPI